MNIEMELPTVLPGQETLLSQGGAAWGSGARAAGNLPRAAQVEEFDLHQCSGNKN